MITFHLPRLDVALVVAALLAFFVTFALALMVRPELRNGKKLSRMVSYAVGVSIIMASILALQTYRDLDPQLWLDAAILVLACGAAAALHRVLFGEPRRGNPHRQIAELNNKAEALTNDILSDEGH